MLDITGVLKLLLVFPKFILKNFCRTKLIYNFYRSPSGFHTKTSLSDDATEVTLWNTSFWLVILKLLILHNVKIQRLL